METIIRYLLSADGVTEISFEATVNGADLHVWKRGGIIYTSYGEIMKKFHREVDALNYMREITHA